MSTREEEQPNSEVNAIMNVSESCNSGETFSSQVLCVVHCSAKTCLNLKNVALFKCGINHALLQKRTNRSRFFRLLPLTQQIQYRF